MQTILYLCLYCIRYGQTAGHKLFYKSIYIAHEEANEETLHFIHTWSSV